jgi:hypothetical protein
MVKRFTSHGMMTLVRASLVAMLLVALVAGTAFAAKGGGSSKPPSGGSGSTIAVAMTTDANANGTPNWGDQVRFAISTSELRPIVNLTCSVGGVVVGSDSKPYYWPNAFDDPGDFTLESQAWSGGPADCRADLKAQTRKGTVTLATTTFHVDG